MSYARIRNLLGLLPALLAGGFAHAAITTTAMSMPDELSAEKPLGFSIDSSLSRGMIEYRDVVDLSVNGNIGYRLSNGHKIAGTISYLSAVYRDETGTTLNTPVAFPERYGFTNLKFLYMVPEFYKSESLTLMWKNTVIFPTSEIARRASLYGAVSTELNLDWVVTNRITLSPAGGVVVRGYRYDDANVDGTVINSPFATYVSGTVAFMPVKNLIASGTYMLTDNLNYQNTWDLSQKADAQLAYSVSPTLQFHIDYGWKDEILTNDEAFAADKSSFGAGVKASF